MENALNIIGARYDASAVRIGYAFDYAQHEPMNKRAKFISDYVRDNSDDRRYTLKFLAASSNFSSAIVEYRGRRLYVNGKYDPITRERTFYVYLSHNN